MEGGGSGGFGKNTWIKQLRKEDGDFVDAENATGTREVNIGGKATVWMGKGDRLKIETPGGGAWGLADGPRADDDKHIPAWEPRGSFADRAAVQAGF